MSTMDVQSNPETAYFATVSAAEGRCQLLWRRGSSLLPALYPLFPLLVPFLLVFLITCLDSLPPVTVVCC